MRNRRPRAANRADSPPSPRAGNQWLLPLVGAAVLVGILGAVYAWPTGDAPSQPPEDAAPLVLPTEPEALTVEEIRHEAEQAVASLLEDFPEATESHHAAAMLYQFLNQYDVVTEHWERSLELDPRDAVALEWLAKAQVQKGQDEEAAGTLSLAIDAGLGNAEIFHQYALVLQRRNKLDQAEQVARQALQDYPQHLDLWIILGQTQVQREQLAEARASFEKALEIDPSSNEAHFAMAGVCQRLGDQAAADRHRKQVEATRAKSLREQLPFDEDYEISLRRTAAVVLSAVATARDARRQADQAERLCRRAYNIAPGIPDPYRQLANMYHRDGRLEQALAVQQRLVVVDPGAPSNHLNLASLLFEDRRLREGEAALLEAARRFPRDPAVMDSLALVYWRSGQAAQARQYAERAANLAPSRERFQLLSLACRQLGDETAAAAAQESAQQLPSHAGASAPNP